MVLLTFLFSLYTIFPQTLVEILGKKYEEADNDLTSLWQKWK